MQWQPVPDGFPLRTPLAILSGAVLIAGGGGLLLPKWERQAALLLALNYGFWTIVLHGWRVLGDPGVLIEWNGIAEIGFVTCGAHRFVRVNRTCARRDAAQVGAADGGCLRSHVRLRVHFHYLDGTASFVPAWIPPNTHFWAAACGAGYLAAGLALLSGVQARLAATLTCLMMACFVVLLHLPRVIAHPELRVEWIMIAVSSSLTGAAWLVRKYAT